MHEDFAPGKKRQEPRIAPAKVSNPYRGVHQGDHLAIWDRLRGIGRNLGMVPPSAASRRALSRAIRASRAACMRAVFSLTPVNRMAVSTRSSFRLSVVLM